MAAEIFELVVLRSPGGWRVVGPNGSWRKFDYRVDAEEAALRLASQAETSGGSVKVLVQDCGGRLEILAPPVVGAPSCALAR